MLVVRAYNVLDRLVVEVTCAGHGSGEGRGGHLLIRLEAGQAAADLGDFLLALEDLSAFARREWSCGELDEYDDCVL